MTSFQERQAARLRGSSEAVREWVRLGLDADATVDVFGAIEHAQVWLLFEPLDHLFGFFRREDQAAGIVLHSGHPVSVQRFTGAHEYGHFVLGHELSVDTRNELFGTTGVAPQEIEAQAFAAEFLMPLPMVNRALDRLALQRQPGGLTPIEAYQLSLELGSSYTATVTQLNQLNKISAHEYQELAGWQPIDVKVEMGNGQRPANPRCDVWLIDEHRRQRLMQLRPEDELHIRLPEIPTSGYRWEVALDGMGDGLELLVDEFEAVELAEADRLGQTRRRHMWWRAVAPASGRLDLRLVRPWQGATAEPADAFSLPVSVEIPRTGLESTDGVSLPQRRAMLHEAA